MAHAPDLDGPELDPAALDVGLLALFVGLAAQERAAEGIADGGFDGLRFSHGFLFQHLVDGPRSMTELARRQEVSVQAVSKSVAELVAAGYLETSEDPADRRSRLVALSRRGRAAVKRGRTVRARQQRALEEALGPTRAVRLQKDLLVALDALGGADAVQVRTVRLPT